MVGTSSFLNHRSVLTCKLSVLLQLLQCNLMELDKPLHSWLRLTHVEYVHQLMWEVCESGLCLWCLVSITCSWTLVFAALFRTISHYLSLSASVTCHLNRSLMYVLTSSTCDVVCAVIFVHPDPTSLHCALPLRGVDLCQWPKWWRLLHQSFS